jgi:primosomal protein N' (replication factor Y)
MTAEERFAEVALGVAADQLFLYRIPPSLESEICRGTKVLVPLGRRLAVGYVVGLPQEVPSIPLKDIQEILGEGPFLDAHLLELTERVAGHYLAPWGEVIRSALPPPTRGRGRWVFRVAAEDPSLSPSLSPIEGKIWEALQAASPLPLSLEVLQRRVEIKGLRPILEKMRRKGWLTREMVAVKSRPIGRESPPVSLSDLGPLGRTLSPAEEDLPPELLPLRDFMEKPAYATFLLFGASLGQRRGWYRGLFLQLLRSERGALLLLPEIDLTSSWVAGLGAPFKERIALLHSGLSPRERERHWRRAQEGGPLIMIGTRSAVFTPHPHLGMIVIDEEHDLSYKQEEGPHIHAREVAKARAEMLNIPLLLASKTPSLESFYKAELGEYRLLSVSEPEQADSPKVLLVDLREESQQEKGSHLSPPLRRAIEQCLKSSEKVVLLINRRGYFSHLLCRECGFSFQCPRCSIPLVLHRAQRKFICHQCGREEMPPNRCPNCRGVMMGYFGPGTQQVEEEVRALFPGAHVARIDRDAFPRGKKGHDSWPDLIQENISILVGTQMVLRTSHFAQASLIGVLFADNLLSLPDFRAGERLFNLLMEMIQKKQGMRPPALILVQTHNPKSHVLRAIEAQDYLLFYRRELTSREAFSLPPFLQLAHVEFIGKSEERTRRAALSLASSLNLHGKGSSPLQLDGPSPSPLSRVKGSFHWQLLVKGPEGLIAGPLREALEAFEKSAEKSGVNLRANVDPLRLY